MPIFLNTHRGTVSNKFKCKNTFYVHMVTFYVQDGIITSYKYNIMLKNMRNMNEVNIQFFSNIPVFEKPSVIVCHPNLNIDGSFPNFISGLKKLIHIFENTPEKMNILKGICRNIPVIIFSCGPSADINFENIQEIQNDYIIISVKYSRDALLKNGILIDFTIQSEWSKPCYECFTNPNEDMTISGFIQSSWKSTNKYNNDILFSPHMTITHEQTFEKLIETRDLNIIKITDDKIMKDRVLFFCAHIMLEVAIPLSIFMGSAYIYTFGWDGPRGDTYLYFDGTRNQVNRRQQTEYEIIDLLNSEIFIPNGIYVYKSNKQSTIKLPYRNVFK